MSRLLFAWEIGRGYGHLAPFRPVAERLAAAGHELTLAVREVENTNVLFRDLPVHVVQAPVCTKDYGGLQEPPLNYAEILMRYGYLDRPLLAGMLRAWRGLFDASGAALVVADHAPTALLAARLHGLSRAVIGSPFAVPPPANPTPNMRFWATVPQDRLISSDAAVLEVIDAVLPAGAGRVERVSGIFDGAASLLTGLPETDPYGPRDPTCYMGLHAPRIGTRLPAWPEGAGKQVFAYLHGDYPHLRATLTALAGSGARCLVYLLGAPPALVREFAGPRLAFSAELLDLDAAVAAADVCVCHGNVGTVMAMLRGGRPMLLLPSYLEHLLLGLRIARLGLGRVIPTDAEPFDVGGALQMLLGDAAVAEAARAFAAGHREPAVDTIVANAAGRIEALACGKGS